MTKLTDRVVDIVKSTYDQMYPEEAKSAQQRGGRIFQVEQRLIQEKPGYKKIINKLKSQGDISKYGIPVGAEPVDNEEGYDEDEDTEENYQSAKQIIFKHQTIGGDNSMGGKTKFRRWLEDVFIPGSPDLKKAVDGISGKKKRNMMKRISYGVRMHIAQNGLKPNASSHYDTEDDTYATEITYDKSGRTWKANKGKRK